MIYNDSDNKKFDILIVDDIPDNIELLSNILDVAGYEISFANNGRKAIEVVEFQAPDLILLDISMPEMDGYEVCKYLKTKEQYKDIPIIFLTALTDIENIIQGFIVGGQDYVTKPFNSEELLARVQTHLELKQRREEIARYAEKLLHLNTELELLNHKLNEQKISIEQKNKDITDSLDYAKVIQTSLLRPIDKLNTVFSDSFVFYKAKDIVSGDFYFYEIFDNEIIVAVADCTGHGVPGALLAMLGTSLLNQIVTHDKIKAPNEIISQLNKEFNFALSKRSTAKTMNDGMDIAVIKINTDTNILTFCGGKRPICIITDNNMNWLKGNLKSVGGYNSNDNKVLETIEVSIKRNDKIYLFSDGYQDQFGGTEFKKFGRKLLQDIFLKNSSLDMTVQKNKLEENFYEWQGNNGQIDDILILGILY